ncbi:MAG: DinB family protein [Acidobacteriota bacterium]
MNKLLRQLDGMESRRSELKGRLSALDPESLSQPPKPDKWSILQIIWHLVDAEQKSVGAVKNRLTKPNRARTGLKNRLRSLALTAVLAADIPIKAPAVVAAVPESETLDFETLWEDWDAVRREWRSVAEDLPPEGHGEALYKHPIAGTLNLSQCLKFQSDHAARHTRQIRKILAA